jgi:hypothetical protein
VIHVCDNQFGFFNVPYDAKVFGGNTGPNQAVLGLRD